MSSGRFAEVRTPLILSILMVLMTQVGYLDLMNAWSGDEETLDDADPVVAYSPSTSVWLSSSYLELTPSVEGADLYLDVPMTNITFEFNDSSMFTLTNPTWTPSAISTSANGPMGVYAADVDGDGDLDIVTIIEDRQLKQW